MLLPPFHSSSSSSSRCAIAHKPGLFGAAHTATYRRRNIFPYSAGSVASFSARPGLGLVRQAPARNFHICAASKRHERLQETLTALQGPGGSQPAAYVVGLGPEGTRRAYELAMVIELLEQCKQQGQQDVVLVLDMQSATSEPAADAGAPGFQAKQRRIQEIFITECQQHAAKLGLQLQIKEPERSSGSLQSLSDQGVTSSSSSSSSSSSFRSLLQSGLGFARRTATAAASAVGAAAAAAAGTAVDPKQYEQSDVDLVPDLPEFGLRLRRRKWGSPEAAALSWHAAVLFCAMIKTLEDAGYEVELRAEGPDGPYGSKWARDREHEVATSLELIKMLLREASGEDDPISDPEEYRQWLVVLLEAEDPSQVVSELESMLDERIQEHLRLRGLGMDPPAEELPTAQDIEQRLDAKYEGYGYGQGNHVRPDALKADRQDEEAPDSDSEAGEGEGEGESEEGETTAGEESPSSSSSSSNSKSSNRNYSARGTSNSNAPRMGAEAAAAAAAAEDAGSSGDAPGDTTTSSSSSSEGVAAVEAAGEGNSSSSSGLDASDAVISAKSNRELIEAMMRLERSWVRAADSSSSSSSGESAASPTSRSGGGTDQPPPELLPRPVRPPQPGNDAGSGSSSSSSASSSSIVPSTSAAGSSSDGGQEAGARSKSSSPVGRVRRINRQDAADADAAAVGQDAAAKPGNSNAAAASAAAAAAAGSGDALDTAGISRADDAAADSPDSILKDGAAEAQLEAAQQQQQQQQQSPAAAAADAKPDAGNSTISSSSTDGDPMSADGEAQLQRMVAERAAALGRCSAADADGDSSAPTLAAAAAAGNEPLTPQLAGEIAEFEAHVRSEFARFEEYLGNTGVSLAREARVEAFIEIWQLNPDSEEDDQIWSVVSTAGSEHTSNGNEPGSPGWWHDILAGILSEDSSSTSSGGVTATGRADDAQGASAANDGTNQQKKDQQQNTRGVQGAGASLVGRSNSSNSSGTGWDQLRSNLGQDAVDKLQELLRGDSLRMSGIDLPDMLLLVDALNRVKQGDRLSTQELRVFSRLLKEAEPGPSSTSSSNGPSVPSAPAKADKGSKRQRPGTGSRRNASLARTPGFNVSAKDLPHQQDMRAVRLPHRRRRRDVVQQLLKQLRRQEQQRRSARQQRAIQLQWWRLQQELMQDQQQQQGADGQQQQIASAGPGASSAQAASSSSSSGGGGGGVAGGTERNRFADAFRGFKEGWQQSMQQQKAVEDHQQRRQRRQRQQRQKQVRAAVDVLEESELTVDDAEAAIGCVQQMQGLMAGSRERSGPVVVAVVPLRQLQLVEAAWEQLTQE